MLNRLRCMHCDKPITGMGLCDECAEEIRRDMEKGNWSFTLGDKKEEPVVKGVKK